MVFSPLTSAPSSLSLLVLIPTLLPTARAPFAVPENKPNPPKAASVGLCRQPRLPRLLIGCF